MRETVVWSPWDFFSSLMQHHRIPGGPQGWQGDNTQVIPTSLASCAWGPPPRQGQLVHVSVIKESANRQTLLEVGYGIQHFRLQKGALLWTWVSQEVSRNQEQLTPVLGALCPLQWEWWFLPCEPAEGYLPRTQHSTGPPANWSVSALELPQQLQGLNLRPWSPGSNLLKFAISNATAQILLLMQKKELPRDFEQTMG